jgi:hypothetical protein
MSHRKPLTDYIEEPPDWWESSNQDYLREPAKALFAELIHLQDAMNHCRRHFSKKKDGDYYKDSQDAIYRLGASTHAAVMSHFETFQKSFFAGLFEATRFDTDYDVDKAVSNLDKEANLELSVGRMAAHRGEFAPVGQLVADSLKSWSNPDKVNSYVRCITPKVQFFSNDNIEELSAMWQIRHSIVHTAGKLSRPDAQKVDSLQDLADSPLLLSDNFVERVVRRMHSIVAPAVARIEKAFREQIETIHSDDAAEVLGDLFDISTPRKSYLPDSLQ